MFFRKKVVMEEPLLVTPTGKVRAKVNPYDFKYYLEELQSDGTWLPLRSPGFLDITQAKEYFERAKKLRKEIPADIGNWNDA
jgi:hypothetical protein